MMKKNHDKKQFDVIVMNPPYQSSSNNKGAGNILWDQFVILANRLTRDGGQISLVHPSLWRKPNHKLAQEMLQNHICYLEIHSYQDGMKTFGKGTRYDWYVATRKASGKTAVIDENGEEFVVDLAKMPFIPNCDFEFIMKLIAKNGEKKVEILHSESAYEPRKSWMSGKKTSKFKYPCVYMVRKNGLSFKWSSKKTNGHFGVPKVIYGSGEGCMRNFYIDEEGKYGLTQWASGVVDVVANLPKIAKTLKSDKFQKLCSALAMSKMEINTAAMRCFRKDFYLEFL